jgi:lipoate-protein ligase B
VCELLSKQGEPAFPPSLVLLEHEPAYTLGRRGEPANFLFDLPGMSVLRRENAAAAAPDSPHAGSLLGVCPRFPPHHATYLSPAPPPAPLRHPSNAALLLRVDRGGDATFHGPGQLTCYPLLDLRRPPLRRDLRW